jgi:hypothetical protein
MTTFILPQAQFARSCASRGYPLFMITPITLVIV